MPRILYGTAWKKQKTTDYVLQACIAGFQGFDTACQPRHYAEPLVGMALQRLNEQGIVRSDYYLQTKFTPLSGQDPNQVPYDARAPLATQVAQSFACSQKNLQTDYVDGLILHSPLQTHTQTMTVWRAMEQIYQEKGARQLGISNCYNINLLQSLYADAHIKPALVQNRFYRETGYDSKLRAWCLENGIIYQSFWTLTANPQILASDTVAKLAQHYKRTPAQILFCYLGQSGVVPLTGTTSVQHMQEDLASFDLCLSSDALSSLDGLLSGFV